MKKLILAGLAALAATALLASPAFAWTTSASAKADCDGTTVVVNVGDEPGTHTANVTFNGKEAPTQTVPAEGGNTVTFHFPDHNGGDWSYKGTWSKSDEVETGSGTVEAVTDCEVTTTTNPPVDKPEKPKPQVGTPIHRTRTPAYTPTPAGNTPPDHHGPPVAPAPKPGQLPFTGAGEQAVMLIIGFVFVVGGTLLVRRTRLS